MENLAWDSTREKGEKKEKKKTCSSHHRKKKKEEKRAAREGDIVAENVYIHVRLADCAYIRQRNVSIELHHRHRITSI